MIRCFIQYRLRCTLRQGVIKMKKKIGLAVISILICGFAFAGCAGKNDTDVAKTSQTENTQTAYQWDTTLKGSLFISDNQFGYKGYSKNVKYSEIFTEADDVKKNTTGANKYSATVREAQKFSDFSTGNVAEKYIFSTEDDLLMYEFLKYYNLDITIVATKYDKVGKNSRIKQDKLIKDTLKLSSDDEVITFSTVTKKGRSEVLSIIEGYNEK